MPNFLYNINLVKYLEKLFLLMKQNVNNVTVSIVGVNSNRITEIKYIKQKYRHYREDETEC